MSSPVRIWEAPLVLPTYHPLAPDPHPMFLENRVYQGSSGRVYPLPFYDRISERPVEHAWKGIHLENEYLYIVVLPELGGRIHILRDQSNGYDLIYNQKVIKPALVGLAGPWVSGGIEFNWPQHHRPATFMPVDTAVERHADGAVTLWCSDHEPMSRMKGMHGVTLRPGFAALELSVRLYNRTAYTQTFLWWANVANEVHELYQSFFPPDVTHVADHAKRATSTFPLCKGHYYGVDYAARGKSPDLNEVEGLKYVPRHDLYAPNDLSWYANIPVPTSYMAMGSKQDFFGGYDHRANAGFVHFANHHLSPGKKQWTWGNHPFGYMWDRNLTSPNERGEYPPYIELMAGVFTDNQPDFSFLAPGETKTFSQHWYPIRRIGPAVHATLHAALSVRRHGNTLHLGLCVTHAQTEARLVVTSRTITKKGATHSLLFDDILTLTPDTAWLKDLPGDTGLLTVRLTSATGQSLLDYEERTPASHEVPAPATEPRLPKDVPSNDELYTIGLHLSQYRHATCMPETYWREAVRRDPGDARCNTALGTWHLQRGEFTLAESHLRTALARQTSRNPNPETGESLYLLGQTLRFMGQDDEAYDHFYKATWNIAWQSPAYHALAEIDVTRGDWVTARNHLTFSLRTNPDNLRARALLRLAERKLGVESSVLPGAFSDPVDHLSRLVAGESVNCDAPTRLDLALDLARAGQWDLATAVLQSAAPQPLDGTAPLIAYHLAFFAQRRGDHAARERYLAQARAADLTYCFPSRLEDLLALQAAGQDDARAQYLLGNWLYDRKRQAEAIRAWERSVRLDPSHSIAHRNLGIAYFNIQSDVAKARRAYDKAFKLNPVSARLLYERDQLAKRTGLSPDKRLRELLKHSHLLAQRDDLSIEVATLYNQTHQPQKALDVLSSRTFQPWEGGEGLALAQHTRAHLLLGQHALHSDQPDPALSHFMAALNPPLNLGEAPHLLANRSDIHYHLGLAYRAIGEKDNATHHFTLAADFKGDFQDMSVRAYSEMTYYSALSAQALGRKKQATTLLKGLLSYGKQLYKTPAKIDYFATSLPTMLLFNDDLTQRQQTTALFLQAQALLGLGQLGQARALLRKVLLRDPNHAQATALQR